MKNKAFNFWALLKLDFQFEMYIYLPRHIHFITGQRRKFPKVSKRQKQWYFCVFSHRSLANKSFFFSSHHPQLSSKTSTSMAELSTGTVPCLRVWSGKKATWLEMYFDLLLFVTALQFSSTLTQMTIFTIIANIEL